MIRFSKGLIAGNPERWRAAISKGWDIMHAQARGSWIEAWFNSDGQRFELPTFLDLQEMRAYARKRKFEIMYVE